jgi:dolichyl-diphosphooligosaccharide--protein glycosyltransferase
MNRFLHKLKPDALPLFCIFLAALAVRWLPYHACFAADRTYFFGTDPYYHLRRVLLTVADFRHMPSIDYYLGYPEGTPNMLAPLMYLFSGALSWIAAGGRQPDQQLVEAVCAAAPTVWGALSCIPVFYLGRQLAGRLAGFVAAACMAIIPASLLQTLVGVFDNNGLEPLIAAVFFLAVATLLQEQSLAEHKGKLLSGQVIAAGLAGWIALFTWRGSVMFFIIVGVFALGETLAACFYRRSPCSGLGLIGSSYLLIGALTVPFVSAGLWGAQPTMKFNVISWFHVLAIVGGGVLLLLIARIPEQYYRSSRAPKAAILVVAVLFSAAICLLFFQGKKGGGDISLLNYFFADNPWGIEELEGLFMGKNGFSLMAPATTLSFGFWTFPVVWLVLILKEIRNGFNRPRIVLFLVWSLVFMVITVGRVRFAPLFSLGVAICLGILAARITELPDRFRSNFPWVTTKIFAIALVGLLLLPSWVLISRLPRHSYKYSITEDLFATLDWMRVNTPATSFFYTPWNRPEYGVLAAWDFGHWINYIARRPAIATPMLTETYGIEPQARFFLSENNEEAEGILRENSIKYVMITNTLRQLANFSRMIGLKPDTFLEETRDRSGQVVDTVKPKWFDLLSTRLLICDGMPVPGTKGSPPAFLQLAYESRGILDVRGFAGNVASIKIFETVKGATLRGKTAPRTVLTCAIPIVTNQGRKFIWQVDSVSGADGSFLLRVPYSSESSGPVHALSPYVLKTIAGQRLVRVTNEAVKNGTLIDVPNS